MDAAEYLRDLAGDLARTALASGDLVALMFEANGLDIEVRTKRKVHPSSYPALGDLLSAIGTNCVKDGIAVSQLRRITFADLHVNVEFIGQGEKLEKRAYSIDAVSRPAATSAA
jgi:hypothetical protein